MIHDPPTPAPLYLQSMVVFGLHFKCRTYELWIFQDMALGYDQIQNFTICSRVGSLHCLTNQICICHAKFPWVLMGHELSEWSEPTFPESCTPSTVIVLDQGCQSEPQNFQLPSLKWTLSIKRIQAVLEFFTAVHLSVTLSDFDIAKYFDF